MKRLSRRTFLAGAGGFAVSLPFLEAMMPRLATAATIDRPRFVSAFAGTVSGPDRVAGVPVGALPANMPKAWKALEPVRQHVSIVSNTSIPLYRHGETATDPAASVLQQHATTPAPMLAGATSAKFVPVMVNGQTADQYAADFLGGGDPFASLQFRVQVQNYSGGRSDKKGIMSARKIGSDVQGLNPMVSPEDIYNLLFSGSTTTTPTGPDPLARRASVLDLVLEDANRLSSQVSGADRERLELHFHEIRELEKRIQSQLGGGPTPGCGPTAPGPDPAVGTNQFVGSSNETLRGEVMAELLAYALACGLTSVASLMLTYDQVFMANLDGTYDMHDDSHNIDERLDSVAENANWHAKMFAHLVRKLSELPEGSQTVLDSTFLSLMFAEGKTAHSRTGMRHLVAGMPSKIKNGLHIDAGGDHPGRIQIAGLQAIGAPQNTLNELTGAMTSILV